MSVFIELITDAFEAVFRDQSNRNQGAGDNRSSRAGRSIARRPTRGIEIKEDTYAYLKVVMSNGESLPLLDSSSPDGESTAGYTNFILQSVQEQRMEKHQIVETFGESYIFFFGESPRFLSCTAVLINSHDFNWRAEWWHNYENYLRGTKLVELGARCYMFWDDNVVEGYMLDAMAGEVSETPYSVSLTFRYFVTKYRNVSLQNVQQFPLRSSSVIVDAPELTRAEAFEQAAIRYRNASLRDRLADGTPRSQEVMKQQLQAANFGSALAPANKITDTLRKNPQVAQDPELWIQLVGQTGIVDPSNPNNPIALTDGFRQTRGLIAENVDEYVMGSDGSKSNLNNELSARNRALSRAREAERQRFELDDLIGKVVENLELIGCQANNPNTVNGLGLGPNFSPGYRSNTNAFGSAASAVGGGVGPATGFGSSTGPSATASFSPLFDASAAVGVSASAFAGLGVGASARAGSFANISSGAGARSFVGGRSSANAYSAFERDPLESVYGVRAEAAGRFGPDQSRFVEGVGDLGYGYRSEFGGAGFGQAGFGDFGGNGYGAANRRGDPGYRRPEEFTYRGVTTAQSSFRKFSKPRRDSTAITEGPIFGGVALNGRASIEVGGSYTAFSVVVVDGEIEQWAIDEAAQNEGYLFFGPAASFDVTATAGLGL